MTPILAQIAIQKSNFDKFLSILGVITIMFGTFIDSINQMVQGICFKMSLFCIRIIVISKVKCHNTLDQTSLYLTYTYVYHEKASYKYYYVVN